MTTFTMKCLAVFVFMTTLVHVSIGQTFDQVKMCADRTVCHCTPTAIECLERGITAIPPLSSAWRFTMIQLGNNFITSVIDNTFKHVNLSEIYLNNNSIAYLAPDAFTTIQDQIKVLDLSRNKLTTLTDNIGLLSNLQTLDVSHNPMKVLGFRDPVMRQIGDWLRNFSFGDPALSDWPTTLHHFQGLETLKFHGGDQAMDTIPIDAFRSFEYTLKYLWIQNTSLISVPIALQYLNSIVEIHFDNNHLVGDAGILIPAFAGVTETLHTLTLENNNLTTFPAVLTTLNKLHNLSLADNSLEFVSDQAVSRITSNLTTLNLQNCDLDRIPGALSKQFTIINLDLSNNHITTVEKNDLQSMSNLIHLDVSHNPLAYISKSTFKDLRSLQTFALKETNLYNVPFAITNIPKLKTVDLTSQYPSIECNCDLKWLYCYSTINNTALNVIGDCETVNLSIEKYVGDKIGDVCGRNCNP